MHDSTSPRYDSERLVDFGLRLFVAAGLAPERALAVAEVLLEGDLLGHDTHGYALVGAYLKALKEGTMAKTGLPDIVADHGSAVTWDGRYLPGPWLVRHAIEHATMRLARYPFVAFAIRRSHHIACLQAFLKPVTDAGRMIVLTCSDPAHRWVAPHGGVDRCFSPDPLAVGIPTDGDPVLIDISTSTTAFGQVSRAARAGERLPGKWLVDRDGNPTDDPRPLVEKGEGALYPLGGADVGYKGFGLALLVEALTSALAGHGRADGDAGWGCSAFLLLIDPERFGGRAAFMRETSFLAHACRASAVPPGKPPVRLPGEGALKRRAEQIARGVALRPEIVTSLQPWAEELGVKMPAAKTAE